jgi:hypothetical protein
MAEDFRMVPLTLGGLLLVVRGFAFQQQGLSGAGPGRKIPVRKSTLLRAANPETADTHFAGRKKLKPAGVQL